MAYKWLFQVECGVVARELFARRDVAHGHLEVTSAGSKGIGLTTVIHEPSEIPAQDSMSVGVYPGESRQNAVVLVFNLFYPVKGKNLIKWVQCPSDSPQRDWLSRKNTISDLVVDGPEFGIWVQHRAYFLGDFLNTEGCSKAVCNL